MKVLLVDDSRTMRHIWKRVVVNIMGGETFEAVNGPEALATIKNQGPFDLFLLDWNMPNMDGFTLLQKIRETDKQTPIIMVTTEAEKPRIVEALKAGATNYIVKPFSPDTLRIKIEETLKKAALLA